MQLACIPSNSKLQTGFGCVWAGCRNTLWWFRLRLKNMFFLLQAVRNEWVVQCSSMDLRLLVFLTGLSIVCNMWMRSHHYTCKLHCLDQWEAYITDKWYRQHISKEVDHVQCPLLLFENSQYVVAKQIILQLWCSTAWLLNDKQHFYWMLN